MVRATIFAILFSTAVLANDIYVEQAQETQDQDKAALETKSTEKNCCHHSALKKTNNTVRLWPVATP
jgi:F0F1-type ATP synthase epsilon subunit